MGSLFTAIIGDPGAGKTMLMTRLALSDMQIRQEKIIANYHLKFPYEYHSYNDVINMSRSKDVRLKKASINWDELAMGADAYDFLNTSNRELTKITAQLRKFESHITFTVQRLSWITHRMRQVVSTYIFMVDLDAEIFDHSNYKNQCALQFGYTTCNQHMEIVNEGTFSGHYAKDFYDDKEIIDKVEEPKKVKTTKVSEKVKV